MSKRTFVWTCMNTGPVLIGPADEMMDVSCTRQRGHTQEHLWYSDDGSVNIRWYDDWSLLEGEWRQELVEADDE